MTTRDQIIDLNDGGVLCEDGFKAIYFLIDGGEIVYVGQTSNAANRIRSHLIDKGKIFDRVVGFSVPEESANEIECDYIVNLAPKLNSALPKNNKYAAKSKAKKYVHEGINDRLEAAISHLNTCYTRKSTGCEYVSVLELDCFVDDILRSLNTSLDNWIEDLEKSL